MAKIKFTELTSEEIKAGRSKAWKYAFGCSDIQAPVLPKFTGCDGKVLSNRFLKKQIKWAIEKENYEWAAENKAELERRKREKQNP